MKAKVYRTSGRPVFLTDEIGALYAGLWEIQDSETLNKSLLELSKTYNPQGYEIIEVNTLDDLLNLFTSLGGLVIVNTYDKNDQYDFLVEIGDDWDGI